MTPASPAPGGGPNLPLHDQFTVASQMQSLQGASRAQLLELYKELLTHHLYYRNTVHRLLLEKINGNP